LNLPALGLALGGAGGGGGVCATGCGAAGALVLPSCALTAADIDKQRRPKITFFMKFI
jgi:hypothetical protein